MLPFETVNLIVNNLFQGSDRYKHLYKLKSTVSGEEDKIIKDGKVMSKRTE